MDKTRVILHLGTHRWIGPKFLLPPDGFTEDGTRLTLSVKASETTMQIINIAFLRQDYLQLVGNSIGPEIYKPAITPTGRIIARLNAELAKNKFWTRHVCYGFLLHQLEQRQA